MVASIRSFALQGLGAQPVTIECDMTNGLPGITIVGISAKHGEGIKERVKSSLMNAGLELPRKRITINIAPADVPKEGSLYDLPIALAILARSDQILRTKLDNVCAVGELGLDGTVRAVRGILATGASAKRSKLTLVAPQANSTQLSLLRGLKLLAVTDLRQLYEHFSGLKPLPFATASYTVSEKPMSQDVDFSDIIGQPQAKRALEIAAAGGHNLLMTGPPGAGKSMLAKAMLGIMPPLTASEVVTVTQLNSLVGNQFEEVIQKRPFRTPHHSSSNVALVGGGQTPRPGEISLSHAGVLFLDEIPEFNKSALEALRQPLEDGYIQVARVNQSVRFPAVFSLVATSNPCPCGYFGDSRHSCSCTMQEVLNYRKKLSGPILDRIDMQIYVDRLQTHDMLADSADESSTSVRTRVVRARQRQADRFASEGSTNATMTSRYIRSHLELIDEVKDMLNIACEQLALSSRSYFRMIKLAQTIADLEGSDRIQSRHLAEALQYRLSEAPVNVTA